MKSAALRCSAERHRKDEISTMKAYKGFNKDMTCTPKGKAFQYKEGETYHEDEAVLCEKGFTPAKGRWMFLAIMHPELPFTTRSSLMTWALNAKMIQRFAERRLRSARRWISQGWSRHNLIMSDRTRQQKTPTRKKANAGNYGAANAGNYGAANAGDYGAANAGNYGAANAGDYGAANAGYKGAANAGNYGAANAG